MPDTSIAIIDIGSNAIRFCIARASRLDSYEVIHHQRAAIQLGSSVFSQGEIDDATLDSACNAIREFCTRAEQDGVQHCRAIATSATREAKNRELFLARVKTETGLRVEIITGHQEAGLLTSAVKSQMDLSQGVSILVDLGGGSLEIARVENGSLAQSSSHPLGALRLQSALQSAKNSETASDLQALRKHVQSFEAELREGLGQTPVNRFIAIGGNINALARLAGTGDAILTTELQAILKRLAAVSPTERARRYKLKPDRACSIVPAALVFVFLAELTGADTVHVPEVSISNALIADTLDALA